MVPVISDKRFAAGLILGQREWKRPWPFFIGDRNLLLYFSHRHAGSGIQ